MLAKRLRELAEAYLEEMEKDFDTRDAEKCGIVLNFLKEAKLLEQPRKPRRPLAVRARSIAERWLDQLEREPEPIPDVLNWVLKMIEMAREEEAALHPTRGAEAGEGAPDSLQDPQGDGAEPAPARGDRGGAPRRGGEPRPAAAGNAARVSRRPAGRRDISPGRRKAADPAGSDGFLNGD